MTMTIWQDNMTRHDKCGEPNFMVYKRSVFFMVEPKHMLTEPEAAMFIGMSRPWLRLARMRKMGPVYIKIGRAVRYRVQDLTAFLETKTIKPTRHMY